MSKPGDPSTIVVTGGNTGLGFESVRAAAAAGRFSDIVVASRIAGRARSAIASLAPQTSRLHAVPLNLASLSSVRQFPDAIAALDAPPIGAVLCNAGVQIVEESRFTVDGFEETFAVNVLGHFLLTKLLLPAMTPDARVIFVSSGTHDPTLKTGMPEPRYTSAADLAAGAGFEGMHTKKLGQIRYTTSKLCDVYLAYGFARRYPKGNPDGPSLVVSAMDPGLMAGSGLARDYGPLSRFAWKHILPRARRFMKGAMTTEASGLNVARLATEPNFCEESGTYFIGVTRAPSSDLSYDQANAVDLWSTCATLAGVDQ
jgi:NAD(P)-dependent dehydrogenase (short-subunit alcohol dehydrogenase family)